LRSSFVRLVTAAPPPTRAHEACSPAQAEHADAYTCILVPGLAGRFLGASSRAIAQACSSLRAWRSHEVSSGQHFQADLAGLAGPRTVQSFHPGMPAAPCGLGGCASETTAVKRHRAQTTLSCRSMPAPPSRSERAGKVKVLANHRLHQRTVLVDIRLVHRFGDRERIVVSGARSLPPKDRLLARGC